MSLFLIVALPFLGALLPGLMNQAGRAACAGVTFTVTLAAFVGLMTNLPSVLAGEVSIAEDVRFLRNYINRKVYKLVRT